MQYNPCYNRSSSINMITFIAKYSPTRTDNIFIYEELAIIGKQTAASYIKYIHTHTHIPPNQTSAKPFCARILHSLA